MDGFFTAWQLLAASMALPGTAVVGACIVWLVKTFYGSKPENRAAGMTYDQQLQTALLATGGQATEAAKWILSEARRSLDDCERDKDIAWQWSHYWQAVATYWYFQVRDGRHERDNLRSGMAALLVSYFERLKFHGKLRDGEELPAAAVVPPQEGRPPPPELEDVPPSVAQKRPGQGAAE